MRVLVCGGRKYAARELLYAALDAFDWEVHFTTIIHGDAKGADRFARDWGLSRGKAVERYPILVGEGGFNRNIRMLEEAKPELVIHFPGGAGTRHMRDIAHAAGVATHGGLAGPLLKSRGLF